MFVTLLVGLMLVLYTIACMVLIFVILIQSGKGGGLSSLGASSSGLSEALGATGAEKTLNRLTTWCAAGFMILALLLSLVGGAAFKKNEDLLNKPAAATSQPQAPIATNPGQAQPEENAPVTAAPTTAAPATAVPATAAPATAAPAAPKPPLPPFGSTGGSAGPAPAGQVAPPPAAKGATAPVAPVPATPAAPAAGSPAPATKK